MIATVFSAKQRNDKLLISSHNRAAQTLIKNPVLQYDWKNITTSLLASLLPGLTVFWLFATFCYCNRSC
jgi:hypothetical protein